MHSEKDKGIGIGINKTATTSIAEVLNKHVDTKEGKHNTLKETAGIVKDDLNEYYIFSMFRNPFDRVVSLYEYRKRRIKKLKNPTSRDTFPIKKNDKIMPFKTWVKNIYFKMDLNQKQKKGLGQQVDGVSINGIIRLDHFGYFDYVEEYWDEISSILSIPHINLPKKNMSPNREDFKKYYDPDSFDIIKAYFEDDISVLEEMGYSVLG